MEEQMDVVEEQVEESSTSEVVEDSQETTDNRTEAEKSLITELQGMRSEMKDLKDSSYRSQQELEFLRNSQSQEEDYGDPDDFVDRRDTEGMIDNKLEPVMQQMRTNELNMLEAQMSAKFSDYDEITEKYGLELLNSDPGTKSAVLASPNPALTLYNLSKSHPGYLKEQEAKIRKGTVDKIQGNLDSTPTVASQGGSAVSGDVDWSKASDAEIEAKMSQLGIN